MVIFVVNTLHEMEEKFENRRWKVLKYFQEKTSKFLKQTKEQKIKCLWVKFFRLGVQRHIKQNT